MRLIDAPIGIFRFDGELVLKTEYYSKDNQSGKYIPDCYIIRTGEYFWGSAKTANELINLDIEPVDFAELLPTVTDTISRQAAIDIAKELTITVEGYEMYNQAVMNYCAEITQLPSIQPEILACGEGELNVQPEIVRCKDCKYWNSGSCECPEYVVNCQDYYVGDIETDAKHFCGYAERKEEG